MDYEKLGLFYLGRRVDSTTQHDTDVPLLYDASDLVTHAVILGMTGSGKTGLGIGLIEEAAIDGIPVLAIDPKGDLSNLLLTFPDLGAADFAPWVNPDEARLQGLSNEAFAAAEATRWREGLTSLRRVPGSDRAAAGGRGVQCLHAGEPSGPAAVGAADFSAACRCYSRRPRVARGTGIGGSHEPAHVCRR